MTTANPPPFHPSTMKQFTRRTLSVLSRHHVPPHLNEHPVPIVMATGSKLPTTFAEIFVERGHETSIINIDSNHKILLDDVETLHGQQPPVLITMGDGLTAAMRYLESKPLHSIVSIDPIISKPTLEFPVCDLLLFVDVENSTAISSFYNNTENHRNPFTLTTLNNNIDINDPQTFATLIVEKLKL